VSEFHDPDHYLKIARDNIKAYENKTSGAGGLGIPIEDLSADIQETLGLAESAVQSVKIGSNGTELNVDSSVVIPLASTNTAGAVKLKNSIGSSETSNDTAATPKAVRDAIDTAVASAYHHAGTKTVAQLTSSLLVSENEGNVYNITDSGETTSDFIEGAGKPIRVGDNVGVCKVGNEYKFDLLSGFVDLSNYVQKSTTAGLLKNDGTVDTNAYKTVQTAVPGSQGSRIKTLTGISQNTNGVITPTFEEIQSATTSQPGIVQLAGSIASSVPTENNRAATEKAVRDAIISSSQSSLDYFIKIYGSHDIIYEPRENPVELEIGSAWHSKNLDLEYSGLHVSLDPDKIYLCTAIVEFRILGNDQFIKNALCAYELVGWGGGNEAGTAGSRTEIKGYFDLSYQHSDYVELNWVTYNDSYTSIQLVNSERIYAAVNKLSIVELGYK
jgi:hypothetical protein